jgi:hypothetical protein
MLFSTIALLILPSVVGCPGLNLEPDTMNVVLTNNSDFPVEVDIRISSEQDVPQSVLDSAGELIEFTVPAGQVRSFSRDCEDLQAIRITEADLMVIGQVGPSTSSSTLRDGTQFNCGDTIQFTFDHTGVLLDFAITTTVQQQ